MILTVCANPSVDSFWTVKALNKGTTNRSENEVFYPGGKGIHTAFALAELGEKVTTAGIWGGQTGRWLQHKCQQKNIVTIGPTVKEWNRLCITVRSNSMWNETELLGSGPKIIPEIIQELQSIYKDYIAEKNISSIIISGSTPRGFKDNFYSRLIGEAQYHNIPTFVDASGPLLRKALTAQPFGVHVNEKEGEELCNKHNPLEIAKCLGKYCNLAAVTAGVDGLYISFKDELLHVSHKINESDIFSTIGSGDCLLAGLCLSYLKYDQLEAWARFAVACGSANCIHPELGMLKEEEVNSILPEVTVTKLGSQKLNKP